MKKSNGLIQFVKFGVVGVANTLVDWLVFYVLKALFSAAKEQEPILKAVSFLAAMLNSFFLNSAWTFRSEYRQAVGEENKISQGGRIFIRFTIVSVIGWIINYYAFDYTRLTLNRSSIISLVVASAAATFWNFFANKLWTYKKV